MPAHASPTNRLHYRHSGRFAARLGTRVGCHKDGLHEFTAGEKISGYTHASEPPGGVLALRIGALCPEETAFRLPLHGGVMSMGNTVVRQRGKLSFVPDAYMATARRRSSAGCARLFSWSTCATANSTACWPPMAHRGSAALGAFLREAEP
ncbi:MAG: hypothetical protein ACYC5S_05735 [Thiobacillus sp.]